ncbi:MAG: ribosome maturation factor RimM [Terracidiphilus sp.]
MAAAEQWAWLARIRRTQGRKGEVFAEILTDFPEKFAQRKQLWLLPGDTARPAGNLDADLPDRKAARGVELIAHWSHKGGVVLHFAGVDSISAAEMLIGFIVAIPKAERVSLDEDQAYIDDLIGCTLVDVAGAELVEVGRVEDVDLAAGPAPLLVVEGSSGEVLVPFAKSYLRRLDLEGKRLEMALPQGLIELNTDRRTARSSV